MKLFDSHTHPHFAAYKDDSEEVVRRALDAGVGMLMVGTHLDTSRASVAQAEKYENVWAAVGLHPVHVTDGYFDPNEDAQPVAEKVDGGFRRRAEVYDKEAYRSLAQSSKKVVAIGEAGLDYYRLEGSDEEKEATKQKQREVFREQAELAAELDLALTVHCREAHYDLFAILKDVQRAHQNLRGVIHCFTGTPGEAERHMSLGFYISFSGIITFAKDWDDFIRVTPLEKLLVETDAPYLTPVPFRGKRNEPAYVHHTAERIAAIKGITLDEVAQVTTTNAKRVFALNLHF